MGCGTSKVLRQFLDLSDHRYNVTRLHIIQHDNIGAVCRCVQGFVEVPRFHTEKPLWAQLKEAIRLQASNRLVYPASRINMVILKHRHVEQSKAMIPAAPVPHGLLAVNPPYGERLGDVEALQRVYALLGEKLKAGYAGWQAAVLTGNPPLGREILIKAKRTHTMYNGPLECRLLRFDIEAKHFEQKHVRGALPAPDAAASARRWA